MVTSSVAPAVRCTDLSVVRGGLPVLTALSLDVAPGQVIGLLGPSGCGKTTLMRSIVGTQVVRDGTVTVLGHPAGAPQLRRSVAYATQSASVYDDLTVRENVRYFAATLGASRADVARVVEHVDLGEVADRLTGRLSGGQRSRVSLAVALLGEPQLLVLDEPTVGLDPVLRERALDALRLSRPVRRDTGRLQPRDGRGGALRRADPDAGRSAAREETPQELTARTGTDTMDAAFLQLIADLGDAA